MASYDSPITATAESVARVLGQGFPTLLVLHEGPLPTPTQEYLKTLAKKESGRILVVKVDAESNPGAAVAYGSGDLAMAFKGGKVAARREHPKVQDLEEMGELLLGTRSELSAPAPQTKPVPVTDRSFDELVLKSEKPVLVDFWAAWCGPCRMVAPILEKLAGEFAGQVTIAKLDVDQNPQTAQYYRIQGIPTLLLFKDGRPVDQIVGAGSEAMLRQFIQKHRP